MITRIKRAALFTAAGLLVQFFAALHWTPATFILSAVVGVPLVLVGSVVFLSAIWKHLKEKDAA
ncbi:MAG: hypothetical protein ABI560_16340 [Myxococcales bacterium]